jgi:VanZ family protein
LVFGDGGGDSACAAAYRAFVNAGVDWWDKAQHALAFAVLTGWALLLWPHAATHVALSMLAYGAVLELAQWAVGWRFAEWADLAADSLGVFVAWGLVRWLRSQQFIGIESNSR